MIEFFRLNEREELRRERANQLVRLANGLEALENPSALPAQKELARRDIERLQASSSPHTSCTRAACELYQQNPQEAWKIFTAAGEYLDSLS
jgi:hypothetical protein